MITDGDTGLLVATKDAKSLQKGLESLLADAGLCRRLGERARKRYQRNFPLKITWNSSLRFTERFQGFHEGI